MSQLKLDTVFSLIDLFIPGHDLSGGPGFCRGEPCQARLSAILISMLITKPDIRKHLKEKPQFNIKFSDIQRQLPVQSGRGGKRTECVTSSPHIIIAGPLAEIGVDIPLFFLVDLYANGILFVDDGFAIKSDNDLILPLLFEGETLHSPRKTIPHPMVALEICDISVNRGITHR